MIGETNAASGSKNPVETVNITLTTDQSSHTAINGTTFTVTYAENSTAYTWEGSTITIQIPAYAEYTISFSEVTDYTTPGTITNTAVDGNSRNITATYIIKKETLTVNVTGPSSGYTITVTSESTTIGIQTSASATYSIAYGTSYTVIASDVTNFNTPSSVTYTANSSSRTVTMAYVANDIANGIYIVNSSGKCYSPSISNVTDAVGVAVVTDNCCFIMSKYFYQYIPWVASLHSGYNTDIPNVPSCTSTTTAKTLYDGVTYTDEIISYSGVTDKDDCAALYAKNCSITLNGNSLNGYLGSTGEWGVVMDNYSTVNYALTNAGVILDYADNTYSSALDWNGNDGASYFTSCEYNKTYIWTAYVNPEYDEHMLDSGYPKNTGDYACCVVPFYKVQKNEIYLA